MRYPTKSFLFPLAVVLALTLGARAAATDGEQADDLSKSRPQIPVSAEMLPDSGTESTQQSSPEVEPETTPEESPQPENDSKLSPTTNVPEANEESKQTTPEEAYAQPTPTEVRSETAASHALIPIIVIVLLLCAVLFIAIRKKTRK